MGQYYKICNIEKKEYITPWDFGGFAKLMEFAYPIYPDMITSALVVLLADGNNRGGGDLRSDNPIIGSWKFDRIVVAGDYADTNYYQLANPENGWKNISIEIMSALLDDPSARHEYAEHLSENYSRVVGTSVALLAHAHKDKQYKNNRWPNVANFAEEFFGKLYPDKDVDYYRTINGIAKHHNYYSDMAGELDILNEQLKPTELKIMAKKVEDAHKNYLALYAQLNELEKGLDK